MTVFVVFYSHLNNSLAINNVAPACCFIPVEKPQEASLAGLLGWEENVSGADFVQALIDYYK